MHVRAVDPWISSKNPNTQAPPRSGQRTVDSNNVDASGTTFICAVEQTTAHATMLDYITEGRQT